MPRPPTPTRDRVLETCRRLFNDRGPTAVTTAEIAATVGINEGNLYYYFKTKEAMLLALFERFEGELRALATDRRRPADGSDPYARYLMAFFELVWAWRFLYRDSLTLVAMAPSLRARINAHAASSRADLERAVRDMIARGLLAVPEKQIDRLTKNAWIVSTYWLQYLQYNQGIKRITRKHLAEGCDQVRALYVPYVVRSGVTPATGKAAVESPPKSSEKASAKKASTKKAPAKAAKAPVTARKAAKAPVTARRAVKAPTTRRKVAAR